MALKRHRSSVLVVASGDVYDLVALHGPDGTGRTAFRRLVAAEVADHQYQGWIRIPAEVTVATGVISP